MNGKLRCSTIVVTALMVCGLPLTANADPQTYQTANIVDFGTGVPLGGAATLFRGKGELRLHVATSGLDPNSAYTIWWVLFNHPGACVGGCGGDDLARPETGPSVAYAAGFVTGGDGTGNVGAKLEAGRLPEGIDVLIGTGLKNGLRAEVHVVVRTHGPILPGRVAEQIGSFLGACDVNACFDPQVAVFPPVK